MDRGVMPFVLISSDVGIEIEFRQLTVGSKRGEMWQSELLRYDPINYPNEEM